MGFKTLRTSDLSGEVVEDEQVVTVVIKQHPNLTEGKVFDASVAELSALKGVKDLVEIEMRSPNGTSATLVCTKAEFGKIVPDEKLDGFDNSRGRRTGYRPNGS